MKTLEQLKEELIVAKERCEHYDIPAHKVRNCPSDLQNHDQAWRNRQSIEYQIRQLEKNEKTY